MSRYIVINLADRGGFGAISSLFAGVTARRTRGAFASLFLAQHEVELIDAFDLLDDDLIGQLHYGDHRVQAVRNRILGAKKIYLATHGIATDVDNCFASAAGGLALCNYRQLASFMMALMPTRDTTYDLALVMCYGARTQTYRTTQPDQQGIAAETNDKHGKGNRRLQVDQRERYSRADEELLEPHVGCPSQAMAPRGRNSARRSWAKITS